MNGRSEVMYSAPVDATANRRRLQWSVAIFLFPTVVYPILGGMVEGRATTEKIATALLMPLGILWLMLLLLMLFLWNQRLVWATRLALLSFFVLTIASNALVADWLMASLEAQVTPWRIDRDEPLDVVVVLGGGTKSNAAFGRVEGQDRVVYAAEIYHQQKSPRFITTGASSNPSKHHAAADAKALLMKLGIPESAIETIGGPNTRAEMLEFKRLLGESPSGRIGILTSAYHLPRAMRLSKSVGLDLIPIAADHQIDPDSSVRFRSFVPSVDALRDTHIAMKEYLASWVGR
jgi:uncharacterized SAM-binding protein YcdF (DUF218 family)